MKIEEARPSFTVYLIASELSRLEGISESLGLAGYMVANFTELTAAMALIQTATVVIALVILFRLTRGMTKEMS